MAKNTRNKAKIGFSSRLLAYILVALTVFSTLIAGGIYAKYIVQDQTDSYIYSPNFYFTSDLLKEDAAKFTLNPGENGTAEIAFQVRNFADVLRISDETIEFDVAVSPAEGITVMVDGISVNTGTLVADPHVGTSANVTVSGLKNGVTYDISVTGKAGFVTTLRAEVTVKQDENEVYMHIDDNNANYVLLTVWSQNVSGTAEISFPQGLIPDSTDSTMANVSNFSEDQYKAATFTDEVSFTKNYSSHVYRFFKTPDYQAGVFTVTLNGKTAIEATPE